MHIIQIISHKDKLIALTDSGQLFEQEIKYSGDPPTARYVWVELDVPEEWSAK